MLSLKRLLTKTLQLHHSPSSITKSLFNPTTYLSTKSYSKKNGDDEWNDAWESAWLPEDLSAKNRAPWETDVNFGSSSSSKSNVILPSDVDVETKAFVEDMTDNWNERRMRTPKQQQQQQREKDKGGNSSSSLYSVENMKRDYRLKKQRIHAGLWMKEIEKQEEAKLGGGGSDDIERLLDSCSEIFEVGNSDANDCKVPTTSEFKAKPDGWEITSKAPDGNIWEISQREEDILLQEFERRIAFSKFQVNHVSVRFMPVNMSSTKSCWPVARSSKKISLARSSKKISLSLRTRAKTVEGDLLVKEASITGDSDDIGIMSIHHVGLLCENLERSLDFYQNLLGLKINEARPHEKLPYRGAWLWVGSEMIHLMELPNPDPLTGRPEHGGRDRHACISIRDVSKLKKVLDKAGVPYTLSKSGRPAIFTRDPDANALEFTQVDN